MLSARKKILLLLAIVAFFLILLAVIFGILFLKPQVTQGQVFESQIVRSGQIVAGRPVEWIAVVNLKELEENSRFLKLPESAQNITVKVVTEKEKDIALQKLSEVRLAMDSRSSLTGDKNIFTASLLPSVEKALIGFLHKLKDALNFNLIDQGKDKFYNVLTKIKRGDYAEVRYLTEAPEIIEKTAENGKEITIKTSQELGYQNVLAYAKIDELFDIAAKKSIEIKWVNNGNQRVDFTAHDLNGNGKIDYVEWTVPHLSEQKYNIIYISKAEKLDSEKNFIKDVYNEVRAQDNNWENFTGGQYVRVTFERVLDSTKDNTIYAKPADIGSPPVSVEVYPVYEDADGSQAEGPLVATFENIDHEGIYRVLLTNLQTPTDIFDLKIIGDVEIDLIVDPPIDLYWVGGTGNWSDATNHWATSSGGSPGAGNLPTSADNVFFDSLSGTGTATLDGNVSVVNFDLTSANITISVGAAKTITASGTLTFSNGLITGASNAVTITANAINMSGGSITTTTSGAITLKSTASPGSFALNTITSAGTIAIGSLTANTTPSSVTFNGVVSSGGTITIYSNSDVTMSATITSNSGSSYTYFYLDADNVGSAATFTGNGYLVTASDTRIYFPSSATTVFTLAGIVVSSTLYASGVASTSSPASVNITGAVISNTNTINFMSLGGITQNADITANSGSSSVSFYIDRAASGSATFTRTSGTVTALNAYIYCNSGSSTALTVAGISVSRSLWIANGATYAPASLNITGPIISGGTTSNAFVIYSKGDITLNSTVTASSPAATGGFYPDADNVGDSATFTGNGYLVTASSFGIYLQTGNTTALTVAGATASGALYIGSTVNSAPASLDITGNITSGGTIYTYSKGDITLNATVNANNGSSIVYFYPDYDNAGGSATFTGNGYAATGSQISVYFPSSSTAALTLAGITATAPNLYIGSGASNAPLSVDITAAVTNTSGAVIINALRDINQGASISANSGSSSITVYPNRSAGAYQAYITGDSTITCTTYTVTTYALTINSGFTLTSACSTIAIGSTFTNNGTYKIKGSETTTTPTNASGSTVQYYATASPTTIKNWTYDSIRFSSASATSYNIPAALDMNGSLTIDASNTLIDTSNYAINIAGNWSNSGAFTANSGTVTFDGTTQTVSGTTTFNNLTIDNANSPTISFTSGTTQTISGSFTATGDATHQITIGATTTSVATLSKSSGTVSVSYCTISYSTASGGAKWEALLANGNINSGNNNGWVFSITAPGFTAGPTDSSSSTTPTNAGANVTFTATASDPETNNYYLAVCKTNSITANNEAAPDCDSSQTWCVSSSTADDAEASCSYRTSASSSESNDWYAFVCDHNYSSLCSSADTGDSPFKVNHSPSFSLAGVSTDPIAVDVQQTFTSTSSDSDTDGSSDAVVLYACKTNDFTGSACGSAGEWCHSASPVASDASCNYTIQSGDGAGTTRNYFSYIIDSHNFTSTSNPFFGTFTISGSGSASSVYFGGNLKIQGNFIFR